ncbi:uncharacterized protein LOC141657188 [Silene latifolia]|uniref:uncharacterized protein LOC141657188 n=1 Tax=Silene latifolia TaxID=37657 RepID=UPI003D7874AB
MRSADAFAAVEWYPWFALAVGDCRGPARMRGCLFDHGYAFRADTLLCAIFVPDFLVAIFDFDVEVSKQKFEGDFDAFTTSKGVNFAKPLVDGQANHRFTTTLQRRIYGHSTDVEIRPLNEEKAVQAASDLICEVFIFLVAGAAVVFEVQRSAKSDAKKEEKRKQELETIVVNL